MAKWKVDAFVASDLHRAIETASIIAAPHGMEVAITPLLRERDWGEFTGMFIPDLNGKPWPNDIESQEALMARATEFLNMIKSHYRGLTVVAVGHGIINKAIQAAFYRRGMKEVARMANAEIRLLLL